MLPTPLIFSIIGSLLLSLPYGDNHLIPHALAHEAIGEIVDKIGFPKAVSGPIQRPLQSGAGLFTGDRIQTAKGDRLYITLLDNTKITLGENSDLTFTHFIHSPPNRNGELEIDLQKGRLRIDTGRLKRVKGLPVFMMTPLGNIKLQDANAWIELEPETLNVGLLEGKQIIVQNNAGTVTLDQPKTVTRIRNRDIAPDQPVLLSTGNILSAIRPLMDEETLFYLNNLAADRPGKDDIPQETDSPGKTSLSSQNIRPESRPQTDRNQAQSPRLKPGIRQNPSKPIPLGANPSP